MNQVQNVGGKNIKVLSLDEKYSGYAPIESGKVDNHSIEKEVDINNNMETTDSKISRGINASRLSVGTKISETQRGDSELVAQEGEVGQLDLTGEGISAGQGLPKVATPDKLTDLNNTATEGEISEVDKKRLAEAEDEMAKKLQDLIEKQKTTSTSDNQGVDIPKDNAEDISKHTTGEKTSREDGALEDNQGGLKEEDKLDKFMDTENEKMPTEEVTPSKPVDSFDSSEVNSQITGIVEVKNSIAEIKELLTEKKKEIEEVGGKINVLGVGSGAATALGGELKEYEAKLEEKNSELQEQIGKLQNLVQANPDALTALKNDPVAVAIPEIQVLLDSMADVTPSAEVVTTQQEDILAGENIQLKAAEAIIYADGHPGSGLARAIKEAISELNPKLSNEELTKEVGRVFGKFTEGILKELKEDGQQANEDVVSEYRDMVKALEASNGVIEVVLGDDGKMSANIKGSASEVIEPTNTADDHSY